MGEFGRIWEDLGGFGRIWEDLERPGILGGPGGSLGNPWGEGEPQARTAITVKSVYFGVSILLYNKRMHYPPGQGLPQEAYYPKGGLPPP